MDWRIGQTHHVRPFEDWGKLIGDMPGATAILDRFLPNAAIITITGKSYRLRNQVAHADITDADSKPANAPTGSTVEKKTKPSTETSTAACET